jgi:hypothetical protein
VRYGPGLCPVAEELHGRTFLGLALGQFAHAPADIDRIVAAFRKVWAHLPALRAALPLAA